MTNCTNCIHYEACKYHFITSELELINGECENFKDKNLYIKLPRNLEDCFKVEVTYKKFSNTMYAIVRYDCRENKPYKIVSYQIYGRDLIKNEPLIVYDYYPSMNFSVIENGFITEDAARKRLEEIKRERKNKNGCK